MICARNKSTFTTATVIDEDQGHGLILAYFSTTIHHTQINRVSTIWKRNSDTVFKRMNCNCIVYLEYKLLSIFWRDPRYAYWYSYCTMRHLTLVTRVAIASYRTGYVCMKIVAVVVIISRAYIMSISISYLTPRKLMNLYNSFH